MVIKFQRDETTYIVNLDHITHITMAGTTGTAWMVSGEQIELDRAFFEELETKLRAGPKATFDPTSSYRPLTGPHVTAAAKAGEEMPQGRGHQSQPGKQ